MKTDTPITQEGDPVLREKAQPIPIDKIKSAEIQDVIDRMSAALATQNDGVAIAAPQIGESLQIFVVSHKVFAMQFQKSTDQDIDPSDFSDKAFINPEIIHSSDETVELDEGCLSVRWKYGKVERHKRTTVRARNHKGKEFEMEGSGLLAQIFQHEIDHLHGTLFIDKAQDIREMDPDDVVNPE